LTASGSAEAVFFVKEALCAKLEKCSMGRYAMGVIRFFVEDLSSVAVGQTLKLPADECKHAKVLRVRESEQVELLDGKGHRYAGSFSNGAIKISQTNFFEPPAAPIVLAVALTQSSTFETILNEATQLGVSRIIPLKTDHCASWGDPKRIQRKLERAQAQLREATKQSGNPYLPVLDPISPLDESFFDNLGSASFFVGALTHDSEPLACQIALGDSNFGFIGPEGDFSAREYELFRKHKAMLIRLGFQVLRSEVAASALLVLLNDRLGRF